MSRDDDRVRVPGNGHDRTVTLDPASSLVPAMPASAASATSTSRRPAGPAIGRADVTLSVTPGQLAVGFGIVASLILLALGRRRRGR